MNFCGWIERQFFLPIAQARICCSWWLFYQQGRTANANFTLHNAHSGIYEGGKGLPLLQRLEAPGGSSKAAPVLILSAMNSMRSQFLQQVQKNRAASTAASRGGGISLSAWYCANNGPVNSVISFVLVGLQTAAMGVAVHYAVRVLWSGSAVHLGLFGRRSTEVKELAYAAGVAIGWMTLTGHAVAGALAWFPPAWGVARLVLAGVAALASLAFLVYLERSSFVRQDLDKNQLVMAWLTAFLKRQTGVHSSDFETVQQMEQQAKSAAERDAALHLHHILRDLQARDKHIRAAAVESLRKQGVLQQEPEALVKAALERIGREAAKEAVSSH